jgi:hypothetical protein
LMVNRKRVLVAWLAVQLAGFSVAAHAYLDPGTGTILVQSLLAGVAGAVAVVSLYWQRVKVFFTNRWKSRGARDSANSTDNNDGA